jgi:predicted dehydrogenase
MVNIVLIGGTGTIAKRRHIAGILQSKSANLYGICARTPEKVRAVAEQYGAKPFYSLEDVWSDEQVDAVLVCTPPASHCAITVAALNAGKHVLCEKTMCLSLDEAKQMASAARRNGKKLMMLHVQRRYAPHMEAKKLLDRGEIGKLLSYRTFLGSTGVPGATSTDIPAWKNAVEEIGSHRIDLARYFTGSEVKRVLAHTACLYPEKHGQLMDNAVAIAEHENGVMGVMCYTRTSFNGNDRSTMLFGTEGAITIFGEDHELIVERKDKVKYTYTFPNQHEQNLLELTDLHQIFCECIEEDKPVPIDEHDGVACMSVIDAIFRSARTGTWAEVEQDKDGGN